VADAGDPVVHVYAKGGNSWRGSRKPVTSIEVMDAEVFLKGRHNAQEGGPKGIDIDNEMNVLVTTCEHQALAFFDLSAVLDSSKSAVTQSMGDYSSSGLHDHIPPAAAGDLESENTGDFLPAKFDEFHLEFTESGAILQELSQQRKSIEINHSALLIYNLCNGKRTLKDIVWILVNEFPDHAQDIRQAVPVTIDDLARVGLLQ
jgi:hypothetical protein